jgi:hypothetical protein
LTDEKMAAAVQAARAEGKAEQLVAQLAQQTTQMQSWVRAHFAERMADVDYHLCDEEGTLIP